MKSQSELHSLWRDEPQDPQFNDLEPLCIIDGELYSKRKDDNVIRKVPVCEGKWGSKTFEEISAEIKQAIKEILECKSL